MNSKDKIFYIYCWFYKDTNEVFYIGKGCRNRYIDTKHSRNKFFTSIINKNKDNVDVKKIFENLYEKDAFELERKLIQEYWDKGQCKCNFHEGGCGGNTGNYDESFRKKISDFAKTRTGDRNPMFGKHHSIETINKIKLANANKKLTDEHRKKLIEANTGRKKTKEELMKLSLSQKGKKKSNREYILMMKGVSRYSFKVFVEDKMVYWCIGKNHLYNFCKTALNISRTIVNEIIFGKNWKPKFNRHKHLENLRIEIIDRNVSTNRDEFSGVEWRLTPFEVRGNQFYFG